MPKTSRLQWQKKDCDASDKKGFSLLSSQDVRALKENRSGCVSTKFLKLLITAYIGGRVAPLQGNENRSKQEDMRWE